MKTEEQIRNEARALRKNLKIEFGEDRITEAIAMSVQAKIESKLLEAIDTVIEGYKPRELAMFLACWMALGAEQLEKPLRQ